MRAAGYGVNYELTRQAMENMGKSELSPLDFRFFFFSWFDQEEYTLPGRGRWSRELDEYFLSLERETRSGAGCGPEKVVRPDGPRDGGGHEAGVPGNAAGSFLHRGGGEHLRQPHHGPAGTRARGDGVCGGPGRPHLHGVGPGVERSYGHLACAGDGGQLPLAGPLRRQPAAPGPLCGKRRNGRRRTAWR